MAMETQVHVKALLHLLTEIKEFCVTGDMTLLSWLRNQIFLKYACSLLNGEFLLPNSLLLKKKLQPFKTYQLKFCKRLSLCLQEPIPMGSLASGLQSLGGACAHLCTNDRTQDLNNFDDAAALIIASFLF